MKPTSNGYKSALRKLQENIVLRAVDHASYMYMTDIWSKVQHEEMKEGSKVFEDQKDLINTLRRLENRKLLNTKIVGKKRHKRKKYAYALPF